MTDSKELELVNLLLKKNISVGTAESCTGGLVASKITSAPGASAVFKFGAVTYSNEAKHKILGVSTEILDEHGAISFETAREMALGIRKVLGADIGISVTGNAGPGASEQKTVGLVFIGVSSENYSAVLENHFEGNRASVRAQATEKALELAIIAAQKSKGALYE